MELREAGTAILIAPNGVRALDALGFGDFARSHALRAGGGGFRDWRGRPLLVADISAAQATTGTLAMAGRPELHRALREPLPDEAVRTGTPVDRLEQNDSAVWAVSGGQRRAAADVAVVADGIGGGLRGQPPAPEQARREVLTLTADWHPAVPAVIGATSPADIYVDAIACLAAPLPTFCVGRIALLGDAAHAMPPDLGQGASQAFEDAAALTRLLDQAGPGDVAGRLGRYDAERRPRKGPVAALPRRPAGKMGDMPEPLSSKLSRTLAAFTIEADDEFEHQTPHRTTNHGTTDGFEGSRDAPWLVSLLMWQMCMRFIPGDSDGVPVRA